MRRGTPWGTPVSGSPDASGAGGDRELAELVHRHRGSRLAFEPSSGCDLARAIGLAAARPRNTEVPIDALQLENGALAINMVVLGQPPDRLGRRHRSRQVQVEVDDRLRFEGRATTVVIANGEFLRGHDVVPRGHPGDGRLDVHVYALRPRERGPMRRRLGTGTHLPHPRVLVSSGRHVRVRWARPAPVEIDGAAGPPVAALEARLDPAAARLLV